MAPKGQKGVVAETYDSVTDGLKQLYKTKIRPVEEAYKFGEFYSVSCPLRTCALSPLSFSLLLFMRGCRFACRSR